jgi:hypothetical protein
MSVPPRRAALPAETPRDFRAPTARSFGVADFRGLVLFERFFDMAPMLGQPTRPRNPIGPA